MDKDTQGPRRGRARGQYSSSEQTRPGGYRPQGGSDRQPQRSREEEHRRRERYDQPSRGSRGGYDQQTAGPSTSYGVSGGRGDVPMEHEVSVVASGSGGGDEGNGQPRGGGNSIRGRQVKVDIIKTKPQSVNSKLGQSGRPVDLLSNYFPLLQAGKWCLYQYRADFAPEVDSTPQKKNLMRTAIKDLVKSGYLFDGTVLYTTQRILPDPVELFVQHESGENIRITLRLVGDVAWGDYHYLQLFNIIVKKCLVLMGFQLIGRNYFNPANRVMIQAHKIQLWPGYITSMRQHERDILLNVDLQFKFLRMDTCYELFMQCRGASQRKDFQNEIVGRIVLTYYNNKTYRIDDVDYDSNPDKTFKLSDGTSVSYADYFEKKYKVRIRDRRQPMIVSRSKPRELRAGMPETVYLVPELCYMTGLTDRQRENFQLMRALADHTRVGVQGRIEKLMEFSQRIHNKPEVVQEIRRWDLNIARDLIQFKGRELPAEYIVTGNTDRDKTQVNQFADWTKDIRSRKMLYGAPLNSLYVITPQKMLNATHDFLNVLKRTSGGFQWTIGTTRVVDIRDDRTNSYIECIDHVADKYNPTMIMVILPNQTLDRYAALKKKLTVDRGIPSQFVLGKNLTSKGVMSIATKITIQMNCKVGGSPWSVVIPLTNLMVVGYDVCRDTANRRKSFSGMVASIDRNVSRYFSMTTEHQYEEELSTNFSSFLLLACNVFKRRNGDFPTRILIFRDGVGDGQLPYVYNTEVVHIKERLSKEIYKGGNLQMAFVVVSKRINTRLFRARDRSNPAPGTVVDDVITLPERYDYFIVSQCVRQGTVSPTSYNVLEDTMGLPPDRLQMLTYKMCHLYFNWSGTIRVPAACQYAHKLAFLTSQCLHRSAHQDLCEVLHFL